MCVCLHFASLFHTMWPHCEYMGPRFQTPLDKMGQLLSARLSYILHCTCIALTTQCDTGITMARNMLSSHGAFVSLFCNVRTWVTLMLFPKLLKTDEDNMQYKNNDPIVNAYNWLWRILLAMNTKKKTAMHDLRTVKILSNKHGVIEWYQTCNRG